MSLLQCHGDMRTFRFNNPRKQQRASSVPGGDELVTGLVS